MSTTNPFEAFRLISDTNRCAKEFQPFPNFIVWKAVTNRDGKPEKQPRCAGRSFRLRDNDGFQLSYLDSQLQRSYNVAQAFLFNNRERYQGLGFVLRRPYEQNCAYTCLDLDWKHSQQRSAFQVAVINACVGRTYIEWSPSGYGVHIWFRGSGVNRKRPEVEIYTHSRFITLTFQPLVDCNVPFGDWSTLLPTLPPELIAIVNNCKRDAGATGKMPTGVVDCDEWVQHPPEPLTPEDIAVCNMGAKAKNGSGAKFQWFWSNEWQKHYVHDDGTPDQSSADLAFLNLLALYTYYNVAQMLRIFHHSELGKRGKAYDVGYLKRTITRAFDWKLPTIQLKFIDGNPIVGGA